MGKRYNIKVDLNKNKSFEIKSLEYRSKSMANSLDS